MVVPSGPAIETCSAFEPHLRAAHMRRHIWPVHYYIYYICIIYLCAGIAINIDMAISKKYANQIILFFDFFKIEGSLIYNPHASTSKRITSKIQSQNQLAKLENDIHEFWKQRRSNFLQGVIFRGQNFILKIFNKIRFNYSLS